MHVIHLQRADTQQSLLQSDVRSLSLAWGEGRGSDCLTLLWSLMS